ncbi:MAG: [FeFe] hydrogenase H-cluster radical SAM maturase HydE [candidate division WOR-3 bacterium]
MSELDRREILDWLREKGESRLDLLWQRADTVRRERVGDVVHLRALIEVSNHCRRNCLYCGIRAGRRIQRYRMSDSEVLGCARQAARLGYGTVVLQAGEDDGLSTEVVALMVRRIKAETGLAVTLSLGERNADELAVWHKVGADRYLLKHETSDVRLYRRIRPGCELTDRLHLLRLLRELGYELGSGIMVGIPGQSWESVCDDIALFRDLDLDMVGIGPFIAHPDTPLGRNAHRLALVAEKQVPATDLLTLKVVALTRLVCPTANIPATTALATISPGSGRQSALSCGANVWMPDLTPQEYRQLYDIYPGKAGGQLTVEEQHERLLEVLEGMSRIPGAGPGSRRDSRPASAG